MNIYKLSIAAVMLFIAFFTIFYSTGIWKRTSLGQKIAKKTRRAPIRDKLLRSPGETLRNQEYDITMDLVGNMMSFLFGNVILVATFIALNEKDKWPIMHIFVVSVYLILFLIYTRKLRHISQERQLARLGLDGELATAQEINQLMYFQYNVYHDFPAEKFNIDHVILGPAGVFAVETKSRSKPIGKGKESYTVNFNGDTLIFPRFKDAASIKQAKDQAIWLSDFLTKSVGKPVKVMAILALPGWLVNRNAYDESLLVMNPRESVKAITDRKAVLDDQTINQIKYQIEERCRTVDLYEPL